MPPPSSRRGHAAIGAIIEEMDPYLPPGNINRPGYTGCRTTYGLLTTFHKRAESSSTPQKEYRELQQSERDLRRRLNNLSTTKGIPTRMTQLLDELKGAIEDACSKGVTLDFVIQGLTDVIEEKPDALPAPKPEKVRMVTETMYKKVKEELKAANEKIGRLNHENNVLAMKIKQLEMQRDRKGMSCKLHIRRQVFSSCQC